MEPEDEPFAPDIAEQVEKTSAEISNEKELNTLHTVSSIYINEAFIGMLDNAFNFRITFAERNVDTKELNARVSILISRQTLQQICAAMSHMVQAVNQSESQMLKKFMEAKANLEMVRNRASAEDDTPEIEQGTKE